MKLTARSIMRILRLYGLADDDTSVKSFRKLEIISSGEFVRASLVLNNNKYVILFGSSVDEDVVSDLWPNKPAEARALPNPLQEGELSTPFKGKYLMVFDSPSEKMRLDTYLASNFDSTVSRSLWQKYIKLGCVKVNGRVATVSKEEVGDTDVITVDFPKRESEPRDIPIVYQDEDVIVINKPSGMLTHAKGGVNDEQTVVDFIQPYTSFKNDTLRAGIVHRLDRDTSGVMICARNEKAVDILQAQFASRRVEKVYWAVVEGTPKLSEAKINLPIARHPNKPSTFRVHSNGKSAETTYKVLSANPKESLVELRPRTGRTHQLRVHMAYIGTPIVGDRIYGKEGARMMLHAQSLSLRLPSGEDKTFMAEVPQELLKNFNEVV